VNHNVITDSGFGNEVEAGLSHDAAELHATDAQAVTLFDTDNLTGNGQAHDFVLEDSTPSYKTLNGTDM
jgi:hypothetical protein